MHLLNFELERHEKHVFIPPYSRPNWVMKLNFIHRIQQRAMPFTGSVYLLVGYKQVIGKVSNTERRVKRAFWEPVLTSGRASSEQATSSGRIKGSDKNEK